MNILYNVFNKNKMQMHLVKLKSNNMNKSKDNTLSDLKVFSRMFYHIYIDDGVGLPIKVRFQPRK